MNKTNMEQHAVPREITSFEFKLIGFMTLRQFYYVLIFGGIAVVFYFLRIIPYVNYVFMTLFILLGVLFAFGKYNDRPIDNLLKNLFIHLTMPTQYQYIKHNDAPDYLQEILVRSTPTMIAHHIDASNKLRKYQSTSTSSIPTTSTSTIPTPSQPAQVATKINSSTSSTPVTVKPTDTKEIPKTNTPSDQIPKAISVSSTPSVDTKKVVDKPYLTGVVRGSRGEPAPNVLVYIKTSHGSIIRLVKTNDSGVFATFHPLPLGEYVIEAKDIAANNFFDTMNLSVTGDEILPVSLHARSTT